MEIINGRRKNTYVYVYEGYSYNKDSKNPKIYRCSGRQTNKCTGTLIQKDDHYFVQRPHTHPNESRCAEILKLKSAMLEECSNNPSVNNKDIFDNICRTNSDAATYISYNSMKSIMSRKKRKSRPGLPKTVQNAHEILENYDVLKEIYKGCAISNDNKYALIFSNTTLLTALENAKEIYMDGTFSVVPRMPPFHQLYTVHIRYNDTVYHY
ncbi:FLYWCH-type zinc finger-containing protein peb-1-like isoform X1 [Lasioglossum baleicum]|uniref:FLYWCH-type zinc finger-containing protein peb-1-like isoform X1 n=1 Tax=Lasioglossum baleicum TaxID=434251 RepID=UPI003FCC7A75